MSLLAGIRFSKKDGSSSNTANASTESTSAPVPLTPAEAEERCAAEEKETVQREIRAGLRDPNSGRPYGLHKPGGSGGAATGVAVGAPAPSTVAVGDRGADWRARALKRAREQAEKSGRSIEEVVAERWGSVAELRGGDRGGRGGGGDSRVGRRERERFRESLVAIGRGEMPGLPDGGAGGGRGGGGGGYGSSSSQNRSSRGLRIGRDARDTDVLRRFSDKLGAAMEGLPREAGRQAAAGREHDVDAKGEPEQQEADRFGSKEKDEDGGGRRESGSRGGGGGGGGSGGGRSRSRDAERRPSGGRAGGGQWQRSSRRPSRSASPQRKRQRDSAVAGAAAVTAAGDRGGEDSRAGGSSAQFANRGGGGGNGGGGNRYDRRSDRSDSGWRRGGGSRGDGSGDDDNSGGGDGGRARGRGGIGWRGGGGGGRDRPDRDGSGGPSAASERASGRRGDEAPVELESVGAAPPRRAAARKPEAAEAAAGARAAAAGAGAAAAAAVKDASAPMPKASKEDAADDATAAEEGAPPLSLAEINAMAAAAMRARLKGDHATHARLSEQVEKAKAVAAAAAPAAARAAPAAAPAGAARVAPPASAAAPPAATAAAAEASLSMAEINAMAAAAMRAKLKGDAATHARLMEQVERAKASAAPGPGVADSLPRKMEASSRRPAAATAAEEDDTEVFTAVDARGRPVAGLGAPAALRREDLRSGARKGKLKRSRTDTEPATGDGGGQDLQAFLRAERERGAGDMDEAFARNVMRLGSRFKGTELGGKGAAGAASGFDEDDEIDVRMFDRPDDRLTEAAVQARQRQAAIAEHKRMEAATGGCALCVGGRGSDKRLLVALGEKTALRVLPPADRLVEGHCRVAPLAHVATGRACDEDIWEEVEKFKRSLRAMAAAAGDRMIFIETAVGLRSAPHAFIEAIPVPKDVEMDAPLYFKQALMAAGDEWSTHRKVIETKRSTGGIRGAVPEGFAYFHVEWEGGDGYVQVVEDEATWPPLFGLETLAGMLGVDPPGFGRGASRRRGGRGGGGGGGGGSSGGGGRGGGGSSGGRGGDDETRQATLRFLEKWRPHDWTAELDGGEFVEEGK